MAGRQAMEILETLQEVIKRKQSRQWQYRSRLPPAGILVGAGAQTIKFISARTRNRATKTPVTPG